MTTSHVLPFRPSKFSPSGSSVCEQMGLIYHSNDLWLQAVAGLSDEERDAIDFDRPETPEKLEILTDLTILTEKAKEECLKKKWKYRRNNGETVILMDLFRKIIKWIDIFKQVGGCGDSMRSWCAFFCR